MITRTRLETVARESGFRPVVVEKVMRLCRVLRRLDSHPTTEGAWLLKSGTALNLLHLDVPRMSVDIDLNYIGAVDREGMVAARPGFEAALVSICEREGCTVKRVPGEHAGGKFRLRFVSVFGGSQNLEVDVSYVARVPLLGTERRTTRFPEDDAVEVKPCRCWNWLPASSRLSCSDRWPATRSTPPTCCGEPRTCWNKRTSAWLSSAPWRAAATIRAS